MEPQDSKGTPQNYGKHYGEYENYLFMKGWKPGQPIHPGMQHHFDKFRTWMEDPEDRSEMRAHPGFPKHLDILRQREKIRRNRLLKNRLLKQVSNFKPWKIETPEQFEALPPQLQQRYYKWRRSHLDRKVPYDSPEAKKHRYWQKLRYEHLLRLHGTAPKGGMSPAEYDKLFEGIDPAFMMDEDLREKERKNFLTPRMNEPWHSAPPSPRLPPLKDEVENVAEAQAPTPPVEKQAQPRYPKLSLPGGNPLARQIFQGVGGPVESGIQNFESFDDYISEVMSVPRVGETAAYSPKRSLWQNLRNALVRPIWRRESDRRKREQLLRTQLAVQSLRGHTLGAPSYPFMAGVPGRTALNEPGIHQMSARPRRMNYAQQTFQQAQARNLPFMSQMILNNPSGYRMIRDRGGRSHWLHLGTGYTFDMPNNPDPSNLLDIRVLPPNQLGWARAQRWFNKRPSKDDMTHYGFGRPARKAPARANRSSRR